MADLSLIDWCVCIAYLAVVFGLAFKSVRGWQDNEAYFVGGRSMNWFVVGVSMFATTFRAISFLELPQRGPRGQFDAATCHQSDCRQCASRLQLS
jgi:Na+/proline symporter